MPSSTSFVSEMKLVNCPTDTHTWFVRHQHPQTGSSCMEKLSAMELNTTGLVNKTEAAVERSPQFNCKSDVCWSQGMVALKVRGSFHHTGD